MEEGKLFLSVTVLYCHDYLNFFSRRSFFRLSDLKEDSGRTFVYVFFLFDSQECPSRRVFTRGSTIVFAPCIHANKW